MKAYIGAKIILAEPMSRIQFETTYQEDRPHEAKANEPGYHVQYSNPDGSKYDSWSPADVFERAYREVSSDEDDLLMASRTVTPADVA